MAARSGCGRRARRSRPSGSLRGVRRRRPSRSGRRRRCGYVRGKFGRFRVVAAHRDAVRETIRELHGYELPELLALEVAAGDRDYLAWLADALAPAPEDG